MEQQSINPTDLASANQLSPIIKSLNDGTVWGSVLTGSAGKAFTLTLEDHDGNLFASGVCTVLADIEGGYPDGTNFDTDMFAQNDYTINEGNGALGFGSTADETDSASFLYAVTTFAMSVSGKDRSFYAGFGSVEGYRKAWLEIQPRIRRIYISDADTGMQIRNAPIIGEYTGFPLTYGPVVPVNKVAVGTGTTLGPPLPSTSSSVFF